MAAVCELMPWRTTLKLLSVTLPGAGCTLGGTTVMGRGSRRVPWSMAENLPGSCCTAVTSNVMPSPSVTLMTV
jgi:hypothetical protein